MFWEEGLLCPCHPSGGSLRENMLYLRAGFVSSTDFKGVICSPGGSFVITLFSAVATETKSCTAPPEGFECGLLSLPLNPAEGRMGLGTPGCIGRPPRMAGAPACRRHWFCLFFFWVCVVGSSPPAQTRGRPSVLGNFRGVGLEGRQGAPAGGLDISLFQLSFTPSLPPPPMPAHRTRICRIVKKSLP